MVMGENSLRLWDINRISIATIILVLVVSESLSDTKVFWLGRGYMELGNPEGTVFMILGIKVGGAIVSFFLFSIRKRFLLIVITTPYALLALVHAVVCSVGGAVVIDAQLENLSLRSDIAWLFLQGLLFFGVFIWIVWSIILGYACDRESVS